MLHFFRFFFFFFEKKKEKGPSKSNQRKIRTERPPCLSGQSFDELTSLFLNQSTADRMNTKDLKTITAATTMTMKTRGKRPLHADTTARSIK